MPEANARAGPVVNPLLRALVELQGSDLHVKADCAPRIQVDGTLPHLGHSKLTQAETEAMVAEVMRPDQAEQFRSTNEADFA